MESSRALCAIALHCCYLLILFQRFATVKETRCASNWDRREGLPVAERLKAEKTSRGTMHQVETKSSRFSSLQA